MSHKGKVFAVCVSQGGGIPKYPRPEVGVGEYGIIGDAHYGQTKLNTETGEIQANLRQVSIISLEVLLYLHTVLGISLKPGYLGENITTQGLGDLSDLSENSLLRIGPSVLLRVTGQNRPCRKLSVYHPQIIKEIS